MIMMTTMIVLVFYIILNMIIITLIQKYANKIIDLIMMMKYLIYFQKYLRNLIWNIIQDQILDIIELDIS